MAASWHISLPFCFAIMGTIFFLQIILPANPLPFKLSHPLTFNYTSFKSDQVNLVGDATLVEEAIQLTKNENTSFPNNTFSSGRVTSKSLMHLWDKNLGLLADFVTRFSFNIHSVESYYGEGMTFFLADPDLPFPETIRKGGGGLGLVVIDGDHISNSSAQYPFMAVEFDTYQNAWDPQGIHVGLDFNDIRSNKTRQLAMDIEENMFYDCRIEYNSSTLNLTVWFNGLRDYMQREISYNVDLRDYLPEWVMIGFSAATGDHTETHTLRSWSFSNLRDNVQDSEAPTATPPIISPVPEIGNELGSLVKVGIGISLILGLLVLVCTSLWKKTRRNKQELAFDLIMDDEFQKRSGPKRFPYHELASATNKFAVSNKLGQGGFGGVYKGYLKDSKIHVAIKRISKESRQGIKEYASEVKTISQLRHRNLVQLIGWCHRKKDLLLIYEFMPNGSLDSHLYSRKKRLTWPIRYNIALSLASALLYLQEEWEQCVIHRDIKSSNVMLDSCFNAKLGDFGLARLVDHEKGSKTTQIAGTRGYIAPECIASGKATKESDIYSFGVVMLEIASGKKPNGLGSNEDLINAVEWVWELYGMGKSLEAADPKLCGDFDEQQMERVVGVGLWCVHPDYSFRPSIRQVIQVLKFEVPLPVLLKRCQCQPIFLQQ